MSILSAPCWQRMIFAVKGLIEDAPIAVGIDCGSRFTKTIALKPDQNGLLLQNFSLDPVPDNSLQRQSLDVGLVKTIQQKLAVPFRTIGSTLSGPSVFLKTLTLPAMTKEDIRAHLSLELDRYIALDTQNVFWDVYIPEFCPKGLIDQKECFLVVAKKEEVEQQVNVYSQCGVNVRYVDLDVFALINLITHNYGSEGNWLLAHIGPTGIVMAVIVQGEPVYIRKVTYEAEWYGEFLDLLLLPKVSLESKNVLGTSETLLIEQFIEETRMQICETLESFSDRSAIEIDRGILLSGGYAATPGGETLGHSLGMPMNLLDPFESIKVPRAIQQDPVFQQAAPLLSVAIGVALRGALIHD